jgi:N-acetylmuramoyl-L-alanine amidase
MLSRPRLARAALALAVAAILTAGCSTPAAGPTPKAGDSAGVSAPTGPASPAQGSPSSDGSASSRVSTQGSLGPASTSSNPGITVVQPSPSSEAATETTSSPSPVVVTTTVTVPPSTPTRSSTPHPSTSTIRSSRPATTKSPPKSTPKPVGTGSLAGSVVVIDPGHNGANHLHPEIINKQVPAGFGEYKNCNTTGTETNDGYPEYRFNWKVALALRDALQAKGITVIMTRDSDDGVGPCVNKRAAIGNDAKADAVVSIHGDGESAGIKGFYVMTASRPPAGAAMATQSNKLAADIRDGLSGANFPVSNALGQDGLWTRSDLAGLNLSLRPTVMIECGNMRNATEAALMSSSSGQQRYAAGIAAGVIAYLGG